MKKFIGLTQRQIAKKAGVTDSHISYILAGKRMPSIELAEKLAKVLKIPLTVLLEQLKLRRKKSKKSS